LIITSNQSITRLVLAYDWSIEYSAIITDSIKKYYKKLNSTFIFFSERLIYVYWFQNEKKNDILFFLSIATLVSHTTYDIVNFVPLENLTLSRFYFIFIYLSLFRNLYCRWRLLSTESMEFSNIKFNIM